MTKLGQLLARRKQADGAGAIASRLGSELAEETVNRIVRSFTATPQKPKKPEQIKQADETTDEDLAREYREGRSVSAPVNPGEVALTAGTATGANYLMPRLIEKIRPQRVQPGHAPEAMPSVGRAAWQVAGPDYVAPNILISTMIDTLGAPLKDQLYRQGKRGYLKSVGEGALGSAEAMRQRSHEARDKYGIGGVPLQMFHGVLNPVAGLTYAGQSLGRLLSTKQGSLLALEAESQVKRATCEAATV